MKIKAQGAVYSILIKVALSEHLFIYHAIVNCCSSSNAQIFNLMHMFHNSIVHFVLNYNMYFPY